MVRGSRSGVPGSVCVLVWVAAAGTLLDVPGTSGFGITGRVGRILGDTDSWERDDGVSGFLRGRPRSIPILVNGVGFWS